MRSSVAWMAGLLVWLSAADVSAQVNTERLRREASKGGWSGALEGSLTLNKGNIDLFDLGAQTHVQHQRLEPEAPGEQEDAEATPPWLRRLWFISGSYRFARKSGDVFINQWFVHGRWTRMWWRRFGTEVFIQHQADEFFRLQARSLVGAGVRVEAVHGPQLRVLAGSGMMAEYELLVEDGQPGPRSTFVGRLTNYATLRWAPPETGLALSNTVYVQPRVDDWADVRVLDEAELALKITEQLTFTFTSTALYDARPPAGVRSFDLRVRNGLQFRF